MPSSKAHLVVRKKEDANVVSKYVSSGVPIFILYHASWCPHCVRFVGENYEPSYPWQQICDMVKKSFKDKVLCIEVEETQMGNLPAEINQIRGFPTLMLIQKGGVSIEYMGGRENVDEVKAFLEEKTGLKGGAIRKKTTEIKKTAGKTTTKKDTKGGKDKKKTETSSKKK